MPSPRLQQRPTSVGVAVGRFALTGTVVLLLVGVTAGLVLQRAGRREAVRDAREVTRLAGNGIVGPAVTPALLRGDRRAIARLDRVVRRRVRGDTVVRVKLWDATGRIVYSDEHRLIGERFRLGDDEREALLSGRPDAELSDLSAPENRFERHRGKLMEVYIGIPGPGGQPLLFETYQRFSSLTASGHRIWRALLPILLGALLLLAVLQVPLAWSLARRVKRSEGDRRKLLERALDAQHEERLRIAGDLHDSVVQNLVGVSFALGAAREQIDETTPSALGTAVDAAMTDTRESIRALRSLLVDIYPPSLRREGLVAALSDLLSRTGCTRLTTHLDAPEHVDLPPDTERLLYRAAREAMRNITTHARANEMVMGLHRVNGHVVLTVSDDGAGFDLADARRREGHFGLLALDDLARRGGGRLDVTTAPGEGTTLRVELPAN